MKRVYDVLYRIFMSFCQLMFAISICVTSYVVFCRYILQYTPRWGEQMILLCMVYMALISASLAVRKDTHIRVAVLDLFMPKKFIDFLKYLSHFCISAFSLFMIIHGYQFCVLMSKSIMSGLGIKQAYLYAAVPIAGVAMLIMESEKLILFLRVWTKHPLPAGYHEQFQVLTPKDERALREQLEAERKAGEEIKSIIQSKEEGNHGE